MPNVVHRGCPLAYDVAGPADGPPVLMIQGVGVHGGGRRPQIDALVDAFRCAIFDNRGMGRSAPVGDAPVTVEQMADDAAAVMDALGWPAAHVVGHSLGGLVALCLAIKAKPRVKSLSLLCTFADGRVATTMTPWMLWTGLRTRIGPPRSRRRAFLKLVLSPAAWAAADHEAVAADLVPLFGHDLADAPPVAMKQFGAMKRYDATPRLGELAGVPTLVMSAAHDRIAPPTSGGRAIAAGIPGARYVESAGASHGLPITHAAEVNVVLREHLAGSER